MQCYRARDLVKAIRKTVALTRIRSAVIARRCTLRWDSNLRHMNLQQAQREFRAILRRLTVRVIGRAYNYSAFDDSSYAILIAVEVVRERGGAHLHVVRDLIDRYENAQRGIEMAASDTESDDADDEDDENADGNDVDGDDDDGDDNDDGDDGAGHERPESPDLANDDDGAGWDIDTDTDSGLETGGEAEYRRDDRYHVIDMESPASPDPEPMDGAEERPAVIRRPVIIPVECPSSSNSETSDSGDEEVAEIERSRVGNARCTASPDPESSDSSDDDESMNIDGSRVGCMESPESPDPVPSNSEAMVVERPRVLHMGCPASPDPEPSDTSDDEDSDEDSDDDDSEAETLFNGDAEGISRCIQAPELRVRQWVHENHGGRSGVEEGLAAVDARPRSPVVELDRRSAVSDRHYDPVPAGMFELFELENRDAAGPVDLVDAFLQIFDDDDSSSEYDVVDMESMDLVPNYLPFHLQQVPWYDSYGRLGQGSDDYDEDDDLIINRIREAHMGFPEE